MDPCPFVRVLVGNLALRMPSSSLRAAPGGGAGVHPSASSCHCRIRLDKLPYQHATAPLLPASTSATTNPQQAPATGTFAAAFHVSRTAGAVKPAAPSSLFGPRRVARLKVAVYAGDDHRGATTGGTCGVGASSGRLLVGKVVVPLDLIKAGAEGNAAAVVFHTGWVAIGKRRNRKSSSSSSFSDAQLHLTVRAEPDPRFVFEFDGEPECSPQVLQVQLGGMKQPVFTCKFSCRSGSGDLRSRSAHSDPGSSGGGSRWLSKLRSDRERSRRKERKGWSVTVHDLSGSPVALASMVTPFVASPSGSDRVSRSNPGAWLILRPGVDDGTWWKPWGRLECWRERSNGGDRLGYRFELLTVVPDHHHPTTGVCVAESGVPAGKGGRFVIDLTAAEPFGGGGGHHGWCWPFGSFRGFVMSAAVQGEGRCSRPVVHVGAAHVGCAEDAAAFVALAAAVDLSMDACRLFSRRLRRELSLSGDMFLR